MKRILGSVAVAVALVAAAPAAAQVSLDLKLAYGVPSGSLAQGGAQSNVMSGSMPLEVAARWRFDPRLSAGIYYQYAPLFFKTGGCGDLSCSGWDMRVGAEVAWNFLPGSTASPWVSLGTGWQWTRIKGGEGSSSGTVTFNGWEIFNLQVGVDFLVTREFVFGPYVGFFGGTFTSESLKLSLPSGSDSTTVTIETGDRTFHGWWQFGLKGTFNL